MLSTAAAAPAAATAGRISGSGVAAGHAQQQDKDGRENDEGGATESRSDERKNRHGEDEAGTHDADTTAATPAPSCTLEGDAPNGRRDSTSGGEDAEDSGAAPRENDDAGEEAVDPPESWEEFDETSLPSSPPPPPGEEMPSQNASSELKPCPVGLAPTANSASASSVSGEGKEERGGGEDRDDGAGSDAGDAVAAVEGVGGAEFGPRERDDDQGEEAEEIDVRTLEVCVGGEGGGGVPNRRPSSM